MTLPNDFTSCENYRGWTIAIRNGRYSIWNKLGMCRGGFHGTRASARREIDLFQDSRMDVGGEFPIEAR